MSPVHDRNDPANDDKQQDLRARAGEAVEQARERSREIYDGARERAGSALDSTRKELDANPVAFLIGGVAIGALLAALLPRTRREAELLGDLGRRLNDSARGAARSARAAGIAKVDELGIIPEAARKRVKELAGESAGGQD